LSIVGCCAATGRAKASRANAVTRSTVNIIQSFESNVASNSVRR
jgi:hypothetical protein